MSVKFIVDSASDILRDYAERNDMIFMPMTTRIDEQDYLDGVDISHEEFYKKLSETKSLPKTSQLSRFAFEEAYEKVRRNGDEAVVITISGGLSGTAGEAAAAAESYRGCIWTVDSNNVTIGEHIIIKYAERLRSEGLGAAQIAARLEEVKSRVCLIAMFDTLEYLVKGGRVSKTAGFAGGLLGIKPVFSVKDGQLSLLGKARGSKQSNNLLNKYIEQTGGIDFSMPYMAAYSGIDRSLLDAYIQDSRHIWEGRTDDIPVSTIGSTIGTHAGPGAIAVAYFCK